ncbi:S-layer homology domain-containing protein, partial [Oscillospiraceae bacterium 50-58]
LGMMVVGSSAAGFPDVDEKDNVEAIDVLQTVKVMVGDKDTGNFRPDAPVSRAEMAVVMANLLNLDYNYYATSCPFTDVPTWAQGCVGACYANGIVSGRTATTYDPNASVTAVEAASMMMRALGYFKYPSDYADGFVLSTVRQASKIGLFADVNADTSAPMTRNQVAQLALNTLENAVVEAKKSSADITVGSGDTAVTINGAVEYVVRTSSEKFAEAINNTDQGNTTTTGRGGYTVELGEQLYNGDLVKRETTNDFQDPAVKWTYKTKEIGTYAKSADLTYLDAVKLKDIYKDLSLSAEPDTLVFAVNGDTSATDNDGGAVSAIKDVDAKVGGKGAVVKVYSEEPTANHIKVTISVTEYYLAKAVADYNADDEELDVELKSDLSLNDDTLKLEDFPNISGVDKGEYLVVTIAKNGSDYDVKTVAPAELIENVTVTSARDDDYVMAGEKYVYSDISEQDGTALGQGLMNDASTYDLKGNGYNLYLDPNGYVLGVESYDGGVNMGNYLFIKDVSNSGFDIIAKAVFSDGTSKTINVTKLDDEDVDDEADVDEDKFYKFSVSGDNYKLTTVATAAGDGIKVIQKAATDAELESKLNPIEGDTTNYANDDTLFVAKDKATTGVKNAPKVASVTTTKQNDVYSLIGAETDNANLLLWVYCTQAGSVTTSVEDLVYILNAKAAVGKDDNGDIYTYTVWQNGKKVELDTNSADKAVGLYEVDTYTDGRADLGTAITASVANKFVYKSGIAKYSFSGSVLSVDSDRYRLTDDVKVYTIDEETVKTVSPSSLGTKTVADGFKTAILVREEDDAKADIAVVYVVKGAGTKAVAVADDATTDGDITSTAATTSIAGVNVSTALNGATDENKMTKVKEALEADSTLGAAWTFTVEADGSIKAVAKTAGAEGTSGPAALADFDQSKAGKEQVPAEKATSGEITLATGEKIVAGGVDIAFDTLSGNGDKTNQPAGSDMVYSWNDTDKKVTLTANTAGTAGNELEYTAVDNSTMNLTGGKDEEAAVAAEYTLAASAVLVSATDTLTFDSQTYPVSGANLKEKMESWAAAYNANGSNTNWVASVNDENKFVFTAKVAGPSPVAPAGTTITVDGEAAE